MENHYRLHTSLLRLQRFLVSLLIIGIVLIWGAPIMLPQELTYIKPQLTRFALFASLSIISVILILLLVYKESTFFELIVETDYFVKKSRTKIISLAYSDICAISIISLLPTFSLVIIKTYTMTVRIPLIYQKMTECIPLLYQKILTSGNELRLDQNTLSLVMTRAMIADTVSLQNNRVFQRLHSITVAIGVWSAMIASWLWQMPLLVSLIWTIFGLSVPILSICFFQILLQIGFSIRRNNITEHWVTCRYNTYLSISILFFGIVFFIGGIAYQYRWWSIVNSFM